MRFIFYQITCFLLLTFLCSGNVRGQIDSVNADKIVAISKLADTTIQVFYTNTSGSLKARDVSPGQTTFEWFKYDTIASPTAFSTTPFSTEPLISDLPSGGYKLHVSAPGVDTFYVAWVFIDSLKVTFEKDDQNNIKYQRYTCDYTDITASSWQQSKFIYYDAKKRKQALPTPAFIWEGDPQHPLKLNLKDTSKLVRLDTTKQMPYEKATFYVHLRDKFGATSKKDFAYYTPIVTKAIIDTTKSHPVVDGKNSAPFTVTFLNKSKNAVSYTWKFPVNDTIKKKDTTSITRTFYETSATDTTPYKIYLVSQSLQRCVDTTRINIIVYHGTIGKAVPQGNPWPDLPNVFTPDHDGTNDFFKFYNISIMHFRITIFSRWGKPVYHVEGANMLDWEGWNGRINNTGNDASEGIYYYVLEVISWDKTVDPKKMNPSGKYKGFFYLFRPKK